MAEYEMFKTTLMGGYDKEEVQEQIQKLKDEMAESQENYKKQLADKDARIAELQKRIELKEDYQARLEEDIREKYQKYIDNYESIAKLVFEAQVKADTLERETKEKCEKMLQETKKDCARLVKEAREKEEEVVAVYEAKIEQQAKEAQQFMQQQMAQGSSGYRMVQTEVTQIIRAMDALQKGFLESYKKVRMVKDALDRSSDRMEPFFRELQANAAKEAGKQENKQDGKEQPQVSNPQEKQEGKTPGAEEKKAETAEFLDEDMEFDEELENEIHRLLKDDEES